MNSVRLVYLIKISYETSVLCTVPGACSSVVQKGSDMSCPYGITTEAQQYIMIH